MFKIVKKFQLTDAVFFCMVWVFFSLNARYIKLPSSDLIRWALLFLLSVLSVFSCKKVFIPHFLFIYVLAVVPSLFTSVSITTSVVKFLSFLFLTVGVNCYFNYINSKEKMELVIRIILSISIIYCILSVLCMILGIGFDFGHDRALGITSNSNTLGVYSNISLLASGYYIGTTDIFKKRSFFISIFACSVILALLSGSRMSFITLIINLALLLYFGKIDKKIILSFMLLPICMLIIGFLPKIHISALDRLLQEGGTTRGDLWKLGISIWKKYPIFGCGYTVSNFLNNRPGEHHMHFHNSYISMLAEIGLWGSILIGIMLIIFIIKCLSSIKFSKNKANLTPFTISLLIMIELLLAAYTESFLFAVGSTEACLFWLLFVWSNVYLKKYDK